MVQLSTTAALALLASVASAIPPGFKPKPMPMTKRLSESDWMTVFNYDINVHVDYETRTQKLFVAPGQCTTLENMWDKDTVYVVVGPGLVCGYYTSEDCTETGFQDDVQVFAGTETAASGGNALNDNLKNNANSYLCNRLSSANMPDPTSAILTTAEATASPAPVKARA